MGGSNQSYAGGGGGGGYFGGGGGNDYYSNAGGGGSGYIGGVTSGTTTVGNDVSYYLEAANAPQNTSPYYLAEIGKSNYNTAGGPGLVVIRYAV
jgi:hypothetical protein